MKDHSNDSTGFPGQMYNVFHQSSTHSVQMSISCRNVKLGNSNVH